MRVSGVAGTAAAPPPFPLFFTSPAPPSSLLLLPLLAAAAVLRPAAMADLCVGLPGEGEGRRREDERGLGVVDTMALAGHIGLRRRVDARVVWGWWEGACRGQISQWMTLQWLLCRLCVGGCAYDETNGRGGKGK